MGDDFRFQFHSVTHLIAPDDNRPLALFFKTSLTVEIETEFPASCRDLNYNQRKSLRTVTAFAAPTRIGCAPDIGCRNVSSLRF